jgi:hypothetical protein
LTRWKVYPSDIIPVLRVTYQLYEIECPLVQTVDLQARRIDYCAAIFYISVIVHNDVAAAFHYVFLVAFLHSLNHVEESI